MHSTSSGNFKTEDQLNRLENWERSSQVEPHRPILNFGLGSRQAIGMRGQVFKTSIHHSFSLMKLFYAMIIRLISDILSFLFQFCVGFAVVERHVIEHEIVQLN